MFLFITKSKHYFKITYLFISCTSSSETDRNFYIATIATSRSKSLPIRNIYKL